MKPPTFPIELFCPLTMGNHVNQYDALPTALFKMTIAWLLCPVLAPLGLLFLFIQHANKPATEGKPHPSTTKASSE